MSQRRALLATAPLKKISVLTPVYNEEETVQRCYEEVRRVMASLSDRYDYEHVFADNCSTDGTLDLLRRIAKEDPRVKVLAYSRNFGAEKSSFTALRYAQGHACVGITADLQEPPSLIPEMVKLWEQGYDVVYGVYKSRREGWLQSRLRHFYYQLVDRISQESLPHDFSGFAMLDRKVKDEIVQIDDFSPYIRGLIASVGFRQVSIPYERPPRLAGKSKHNAFFLLNFGMNGIISHSLVPIRLATLAGAGLASLSILISIAYALVKVINWQFQAPGATTTVVLILFFAGIQLFFLGLLGEYVGAIHGQVRRKPFVIIREKINFDDPI